MASTITASYQNKDNTVRLESAKDVSRFLAHMAEQAVLDPDNTCAWLYIDNRPVDEDGIADHEMRVGVIPNLPETAPDGNTSVKSSAWTLGFTDARGSTYVKGHDSGLPEISLFVQGHSETFPADSVVDGELVRAAILDAIATGERPTTVTWSPTH
ncbi:hypothetical protein GCM10009804_67470 [Kribbella hippodromi]|uniref:Immunity protein Imm1 n=1 Tax=Kribbella hippodromi TaxID=434347 RepID=A0ABP4Q630_9ACTN